MSIQPGHRYVAGVFTHLQCAAIVIGLLCRRRLPAARPVPA